MQEGFIAGVFDANEARTERLACAAEIEKEELALEATERQLIDLGMDDDLAKAEVVIGTLMTLAQFAFPLNALRYLFPNKKDVAPEWLDALYSDESPIRKGELLAPSDQEMGDQFLELVRNLVKRVTINQYGEIQDYVLRIQPPPRPDDRSTGTTASKKGDKRLKDGISANYKANLKCITSPSCTG